MASKNWWEKKDPATYSEWQALKTQEGLDYYYNTVTNETTWDKPDALKTEEELANQGEMVWCPDEQECFIPATISNRHAGGTDVVLQNGERRTMPKAIVLAPLRAATLQRIVGDLTLLDSMDTALILHNLKQRFLRNEIYTNIGTILISINPYQSLNLYTPEKIYEYQYRGVKEMPPHVFNVAHESYKGLADFGTAQSIIISGESGAGKTEATKQCLSYIAAVAGSVGGVEQKVLQANPILEAFGNAKTVRNDNSSRFGKYMEIYFNKQNQIRGSTTTNYLLEKIRVVSQGETERNFHIFYQLVIATNNQQKQKYQLSGDPNDYCYLNQSGCTEVPTIDDASDFSACLAGMSTLGFEAREIDDVLATTSAVLALGNIDLVDAGSGKSKVGDKGWLDVVASLLQVTSQSIEEALTSRILKIKGAADTKTFNDKKIASDTRHALAKFIYGNQFDWIVQKINKSMKEGASGTAIGILDIFGFEIFKHNSFEQLMINFTNEMLQQHFNNNTFKLEEQVYKSEGVQFKHVDFIDNQPVLDLITDKREGLLTQLDEELVVPKGSDSGFLGKIKQKFGLGKSKIYKDVRANPDFFIIQHYAGEVTYDGNGFLEKNRDTLTEDCLQMLYSTKSKYIQTLFPSNAAVSSKEKKASLSKQFQGQLTALMSSLYKTEPHYIRCVKPNGHKAAMQFVPRDCLEQLTYSGVFEAVIIRKQGFPFRLKHDAFVKHYTCVLNDPKKQFSNPVQGCKEIIAEMRFGSENVRMGTTMVLYRADEHKAIELQRSIKVVRIEMEENLQRLTTTNISGFDAKKKEKYFEELSRAVEQADEFRIDSPVANKARELLDTYIESRIDDATKQMLQRAYDAVDPRLLEQALQVADAAGFKTKLCKECRRLLTRIQRIEEEVLAASELLYDEHVQACVSAADEIRYSSEWLQYFRELVNGPPIEFLTAQYDKAVENNVHDRAIRLDIKRKDILYQTEAAKWDYRKFTKLKDPAVWASEKWFGKKDELMAGMLEWQSDKIHAPILKHDGVTDKEKLKELTLKCRQAHGFILKYMGQRKAKRETGIVRGRMAVSYALDNPEIRDETFLLIIKQLSNNPDPEATKTGWDCMALCLMTFPPSKDLENYLEVFLRANAPSGKLTHQFKGWLRQRMYHGPVKVAPTDAEMEHREQTLSSRARGFSEPLPPGVPQYQDLLESYASQAPQGNQFRREIGKGQQQQQGAKQGAKQQAQQQAQQQQQNVVKQGGYVQKKQAPALAPKPVQQKSDWEELLDEASGDVYYWNSVTNESSWDKPAELMYQRASVAQRGW